MTDRCGGWLLRGVVLLAALLAIAAGVAHRSLEPVAPGSTQRVVFVVAPGDGLGRIARRLERSGLVRSALAFEMLARWRGLESRLRSGDYELSPALQTGEILRQIGAGHAMAHDVVVPEGATAAQIAERLAEAGVLRREEFLADVGAAGVARELGVEGDGLEGYLFPDTYRFPRGLSARSVTRVFVERFQRAWREIAPLAAEQGLGMKEVVTLASLVERETGRAEERPLIASVFLNRLRRGMRLETDPAVIYGIPAFDGNLRRHHLEDTTNPYNTYVIPGLPPGPIANPGREALRAVVRPTASDYLYFVSRNDGWHVFLRTYSEHRAAIDRYQRQPSATGSASSTRNSEAP